ncbi:MAG: peptidoglycan DD-metalloendopeptidase family protein [Anaerolineae bacterium]|nr:peptidoglycan DD-metalloendopeptidase family protein [Anaerolineae bacterium]
MTARLFRYDIETNTLEDLEEIAEGTNDAYSYQLGIASDGKVYIAVNNYVLRMYDPLNAGQGIIDAGVGYRPITFGADGKLYAVFGTQLLRNDILYQGYAISGVTHDPQQLPVAGVVLKTSEGHIAVSQANGQYAFTGLNSGIYTITEAALSYHTIPFSRVVQLPPSLVQQDFVVRQIPEPFLDLPVSYDSFAQAAKGNISGRRLPGRVNAWFDHNTPDYESNEVLHLWNRESFTATQSISLSASECDTGFSCYDGHNAIDFQKMETDEPIFAAADGSVTEIFDRWPNSCGSRGCSYGNYVWIDHDNGYATFYAHLQSVDDSIIAPLPITVTQGITIGIMGGTGGHPVHLHFGLYYDADGDDNWEEAYRGYTEAVDPYGWELRRPENANLPDPWKIRSIYLWQHSLVTDTAVSSNEDWELESVSGNWFVKGVVGSVQENTTIEFWDAPPAAALNDLYRSTGNSIWLNVLPTSTVTFGDYRHLSGDIFASPVTLTVNYLDASFDHLDETQLAIAQWNEALGDWSILPTDINLDDNRAETQIVNPGSFDLVGSLRCPVDQSEPDDYVDFASRLTTSGITSSIIFDIELDEDWFVFDAERQNSYLLETTNLSLGVDTILELYDFSGTSLLSYDDNSGDGLASQILWQAPRTGSYYVRVAQAPGSSFGCDASYEISITDLSPELSIARDTDDIDLSWSDKPHAINYEVWRGITPFFSISDPGTEKIADVSPPINGNTVTYIDVGSAEDGNEYYYLIQATSIYTDSKSNRVGKMDIPVLPGWNLISWPILPTSTMPDVILGAQLFGTESPETSDRIFVWDAASQSYDYAWFCSGPICESYGTDYFNHWLSSSYSQTELTLEPDTGFWIQNRSGMTETLTFVGNVPHVDRYVDIASQYSLLGSSIPLTSTLDDAGFLATGTGDPLTADTVLVWDNASQSYESAWFCGGPICESWGPDYYNRWLAFDYSPSEIVLLPGRGFWYQNRHQPFVWVNNIPDP